MLSAQQSLDVISNNLANVSTNGFKRDQMAFQDTLVRTMRAAGGTGQVLGSMGSGAQAVGEFSIQDAGPVNHTGNPLDVAIQGAAGMFAVQTPQGVQYTRDGSFQLDGQGQIVTKDGYPILDTQNNPINVSQTGPLSIDAQGNVLSGSTVDGQIGLFDGTFSKVGGNLYTGQGQPAANPNLIPGALEGSNVNAIQSMVDMITLSRQYDLAQKSITTQDELTDKLIQSL
jgi:flagellar basal-body rod protein FlgG